MNNTINSDFNHPINTIPKKELVIFPAYNMGNSELFHFIRSLADKELLERVLLICPLDFFAVFPVHVPYYIADDFDSLPRLIKKIEEWQKRYKFTFKRVLGIDEELHFQMSKTISHFFELPFFEDYTCYLGSNKVLLKQAFRACGVPTGDYAMITQPHSPEIKKIGFPNVLKVISGTQSEYLFLNENQEQLQQHFLSLQEALQSTEQDPRFRLHSFYHEGEKSTFNPREQFLLEAFVAGDEYSCDFIIDAQSIRLVRVVKKIKGPYLGFFSGYQLLNEVSLQENGLDKLELLDVCAKIKNALSADTGVCMVDFKFHQGQITVLEASIRPGLSAFNHLMYEVYGFTSLALAAMQCLDVVVPLSFPKETGAIIYLFSPVEYSDGVMDIKELKKQMKKYGIFHIHTYDDEPGEVKDAEVDRSVLLKGYVVIKNKTLENLPAMAQEINGLVQYRQRKEIKKRKD